MQLKLIFLFTAFIFAGCASGQRKICKTKPAFSLGLQHGSEGTSNLSIHYKKICSEKISFSPSYSKGYNEGLTFFCSFKRGESQALYGLAKESICKNSAAYSSGHQKALDTTCSKEKARSDVIENLNTTNTLCKKNKSYKKTYLSELNRRCSFKRGYTIGYTKKNNSSLCVDSSNLKRFKQGYRLGFKDLHINKNYKISRKLKTLRKKRSVLKRRLKKTKNSDKEIELNLSINKLETKILDFQTNFEENKKIINR